MVAACRKSVPSPTGSHSIRRFQGPCPEKIFLNKIKLGHTKPESREIHSHTESSIGVNFASTNPSSRPSNYRLSGQSAGGTLPRRHHDRFDPSNGNHTFFQTANLGPVRPQRDDGRIQRSIISPHGLADLRLGDAVCHGWLPVHRRSRPDAGRLR